MLFSNWPQPVIIDGALATEMEQRGADLHDSLWSARYLMESPDLIRDVHLDYLNAGARIIITASYQASIPGFMARGMSYQAATELIGVSVELAMDARQRWSAQNPTATYRPLIAGSVGPYGAYTADGGEYRGNYGLSTQQLRDFHRPRLEILLQRGVDLLACETIPDLEEAIVLAELIAEYPSLTAWMSFSCPNDTTTWAGQSLVEVAQAMSQYPHIVAIGSNCTAPQYMPGIITTFRQAGHEQVVVYPNSGEMYNATDNRWYGTATCDDYVVAAHTWVTAGATIIGGCCRTNPETIAALVATFSKE
ncbi:MAG: homocysteine S-methyltransferase [Roseiflexaceae bacterium]